MMNVGSQPLPRNHTNERYFFCEITEVNGEHEYRSVFLMKCLDSGSQDPDVLFDNIFTTFRGEGDREHDCLIMYPDGTAAKDPEMVEISLEDFQVMQKYIKCNG